MMISYIYILNLSVFYPESYHILRKPLKIVSKKFYPTMLNTTYSLHF